EALGRHDLVGVQHEQGQQAARRRSADVDDVAVVEDLHRPQDPELHARPQPGAEAQPAAASSLANAAQASAPRTGDPEPRMRPPAVATAPAAESPGGGANPNAWTALDDHYERI